jgi:hypothetical protein
MITWVLVALIVVGALLFIKVSHYRHRFFVITIVVVALFLYISVAYVASKNNLDFTTYDGLVKSVNIYMGWLFNLAGNFKTLTGSAVKLDWTSTNGTVSSLSKNVSVASSNSPGITGRASARFAN